MDSLSYDMSSNDQRIRELVPVDLISYRESVQRAFSMIEQNQVKSSWIDSLSSGRMQVGTLRQVEVPTHGVLTDRRDISFERNPDEVAENIWRIGGKEGWYTMDWAWRWIISSVGPSTMTRTRFSVPE